MIERYFRPLLGSPTVRALNDGLKIGFDRQGREGARRQIDEIINMFDR